MPQASHRRAEREQATIDLLTLCGITCVHACLPERVDHNTLLERQLDEAADAARRRWNSNTRFGRARPRWMARRRSGLRALAIQLSNRDGPLERDRLRSETDRVVAGLVVEHTLDRQGGNVLE
jgi:hypothetical protein